MIRHLALAIFILSTLFSFAKDKDRFQQPGPIRLDKDGQKWVEKALRKMSPEEKVGQLFMIWTRVTFMNEADPAWIALRDSVRKYHIGGLCMSVPVDGAVLMRNQPYEAAELLNRLQQSSELPLIFAADFERGGQRR